MPLATPTPPQPQPIISMRSLRQADGSFAVELTVSGLASERQAQGALAHLQRVLCGDEISSH